MKKIVYKNGINELSEYKIEREVNNYFHNDTAVKIKRKNFLLTGVAKKIIVKTYKGNILVLKEKFII